MLAKMMQLPKLFILICIYLCTLSCSAVLSLRAQALCPIMCRCYNHVKMKKVECDGRKLINPNIEAPVKTEFLDLSNNMIATLDKQSFEGLYDLVKIRLYANAIATVYPDTFLRQRKLIYVDLSDNRIEELDERIFDANRNLKIVILSYNKFSNLFNRPFLVSDSIEILNLKKCQISHIFAETFKHLPHLKTLDLSANLLASINVQHMKPLKLLSWLDFNGNPWKCDKNIETVRQWTTSNDIMFFMVECQPKSSGMFEKLVESTNKPEKESIEADKESDSIEDWLIDNEENNPKSRDYEEPNHVHEMYIECQERFSIIAKEQKRLNSEIKFNSTKSVIFFFFGIVIGVLVCASLCFLVSFKKTKRKWEQRNLENNVQSVAVNLNNVDNNEIIFAEVNPPPDVTRRRCRPPNRQRPKKSFFATLFERRRVYRRFHPPTLIRRLSRSNLFSSTFGLNRSESRPRLDRQNSRRQNTNNPSSTRIHDVEQRRLLNNSDGDFQITNTNISTERAHPRQNTSQLNTVTTTESNTAPISPVFLIEGNLDTPPPTYNECMITLMK